MDNSMIKGILIGGIAVVAVTASGITGYKAMNKPVFAEVLAAKEIKETIKTPREECQEVQVQKKAPVKEQSRRGITDGSSLAAGARPENTPLLPRLTPTHSIQAP